MRFIWNSIVGIFQLAFLLGGIVFALLAALIWHGAKNATNEVVAVILVLCSVLSFATFLISMYLDWIEKSCGETEKNIEDAAKRMNNLFSACHAELRAISEKMPLPESGIQTVDEIKP